VEEITWFSVDDWHTESAVEANNEREMLQHFLIDFRPLSTSW